jgi:lipopolysaccharide/colanic/teichoic acid biosynthesis glycosyltransferase
VALVVAGGTLLLVSGDPGIRVGWAMVAGELAALLFVMLAAEVSDPESPDTAYDLVKRGIDLIASGTLMVLTSPLLAALAVAVKLDSPGPVFFRQPRIGKNERPFVMIKFRSMVDQAGDELLYEHLARVGNDGYVRPDTAASGPRLYIDDDPRVTRVGRWLRKTSLDELPNLWSVFRGDMSLVGPRPLVPAEVELLDPNARARSRVRPGMTGLAQVEGGSELTFGERAHWDLEYVERRSLLLDLRILTRTPLAALGRRP